MSEAYQCKNRGGCYRSDCGKGLAQRCKAGESLTYSDAEIGLIIQQTKRETAEKFREILGTKPLERPEIGDSIGNYDDTYYDGYGAARFDFIEKLEAILAVGGEK